MQQETVNVFIAYAREDSEIKERLKKNLKAIFRNNQEDSLWDDGDIHAGDDWKKAIHKALEQADIFLLLLSPDFIASDFCYDTEMQEAMEKHQKEEAIIIPLQIRACSWQNTPLKDLQILPEDKKAIHRSNEQHILDELYLQITERLHHILNTVKEQKRIKKLKEQFDKLFQKAEEEFKNQNWQEAIKNFEESLKYYDPSFEKNVQELIEFCQKQIQLSELLIKAKSYRDANDLYSFYSIAKDAFEIMASNEAKSLLKEAANGLFNITIERADTRFLAMDWAEAYKIYQAAFRYINEGNIIVDRKIINRRRFCFSMVDLSNITHEWLNHDKIDNVFAGSDFKEILKKLLSQTK